ncbi:MAG: hypothetical protein IH948_06460, partial [Bacteroidetes bacterium]|nr:hypothetical protein [Bacteroidota bacterium]
DVNIFSKIGIGFTATGQPYSANNPIPIDVELPKGLIFKVQIGAFKNPIPQDLFSPITPIMGEDVPGRFKRYTAGMFRAYESADYARSIIRKLGYSDAFVVAFFDGERISLYKGLAMINEGDGDFRADYQAKLKSELATLEASAPDIARIEKRTRVVDATSTEVDNMNGLFYTVQVGVFGRPVTRGPLLQLQPLFRKTTSGGLLKYSSGLFTDVVEAINHRDQIRRTVVQDAFLIAYNNGGRVTVQVAKNIEAEGGQSVFAKIPAGATKTVVQTEEKKQIADNEANANEVNFKVQIGAYKVNLSEKVASLFVKLAGNHGLDHYVNSSGAKVFTIGAFRKYKDALVEKERINANGVPDAFIVAFHGKKRISVAEANRIIRP